MNKILRHVEFKRPRVRIRVTVYEQEATGELSVLVNTRRLVGRWQDRHISRANIGYSLETFIGLHCAFSLIDSDPLFRKKANRFMKDFEQNPFKGATSCKQ